MKVIKRNGTVQPFDKQKIVNAIYKAGHETGEFGKNTAEFLAEIVKTEVEQEHDGIPYFANFVNSDLAPEDARSMCLDKDENVFIKVSDTIQKRRIEVIVNKYKRGNFDKEGWVDAQNNIQALSLNYDTGKTEWVNIKGFLRIKANQKVIITTNDGKVIKVSPNHLIPVVTPYGLKNKLAKDVKRGDMMLSLKDASVQLSKHYQHIGNFVLDEELASFLGYFTANGNYLFKSRKRYTSYDKLRGIQITLNSNKKNDINKIKNLIKKVLYVEPKEHKDPRYNTYYLYVYRSRLGRLFYNSGFKKYGHLPQILFNSPPSVIKDFLTFFFKGDGYKIQNNIHMNDRELSEDLVILYSLIGIPVTYKIGKNFQNIHIQKKTSEKKSNGYTNNPILAERIPSYFVHTSKVPGLTKKQNRTVGISTIEKYNAGTPMYEFIKQSDFYIISVKNTQIINLEQPNYFYNFKLKKNYLFIHSMGTITHSCYHQRLNSTTEPQQKTVDLSHIDALTNSIESITINNTVSQTYITPINNVQRLTTLLKEGKNDGTKNDKTT